MAEYKVNQKASFEGKSWDFYRLVMTQGAWRIRMGETTELQFSLLEGGLLRKLESIPVTENREAYSVYVVEAEFVKGDR